MKKPSTSSRPSIYQTVTDRIISSLKAGMIPWEKPWKTPRYAGGPFPRGVPGLFRTSSLERD
jgi:antirestriction protein ArdC